LWKRYQRGPEGAQDAASCGGQVVLLQPTGAALPPPQFWTAPGFAVGKHHLLPYVSEGRQRTTLLVTPCGRVIGHLAVNSDRFQPVRRQAGDLDFYPDGTLTKTSMTKTSPYLMVAVRPERLAELTEELFGDQPG
jgi:hypothetical protein